MHVTREHGKESSRTAADRPTTSQGESGLPTVEDKDGVGGQHPDGMFPWEMDANTPGTGAADVANAKNPNDHTSSLAKAAAFRAQVQANLARFQ